MNKTFLIFLFLVMMCRVQAQQPRNIVEGKKVVVYTTAQNTIVTMVVE